MSGPFLRCHVALHARSTQRSAEYATRPLFFARQQRATEAWRASRPGARPILLPVACCRPFSTKPPHNIKPRIPPRELHESIYTIPNALTLARILACPWLGYAIVQGDMASATGLLVACGFSDWLDGWIARKWHIQSVLGSILDPAADKLLMTTLVVTLAWSQMLPLWLAVIILGRDVALSFSAFYIRFASLAPPRTLRRYFDPTMPSAEVKPTQISKINTALQLLLMGATTAAPLLPFATAMPLTYLQWTVAGTTVWSGLSYLTARGWSKVAQ